MHVWINTNTISTHKQKDPNNEVTIAFSNIKKALESLNHKVTVSNDCKNYDCVFIFGAYKKAKNNARNDSIKKCQESQKPMFCIDSGLFSTYARIHRKNKHSNLLRIGLNDCTGIGDFLNQNSTNKRYEQLKKTYQFSEMPPTSNEQSHILFLLQNPGGWQYDSKIPYDTWLTEQIEKLQKITDQKIVLRLHPITRPEMLTNIKQRFSKNFDIQHPKRERMSSIAAIKKSSCVITHSSSSAMEAYIEGVPAIALSSRCLGYDHLFTDLNDVNRLNEFNWSSRYQNLCNWAMTTWHINELADPDVMSRYINYINR